ncbi:hypothetical protein BC826DRAFT_715896 [Russula brevipes]|nr:hypothetical protein BC826DRAFT_715896 [Russula brevipes]
MIVVSSSCCFARFINQRLDRWTLSCPRFLMPSGARKSAQACELCQRVSGSSDCRTARVAEPEGERTVNVQRSNVLFMHVRVHGLFLSFVFRARVVYSSSRRNQTQPRFWNDSGLVRLGRSITQRATTPTWIPYSTTTTTNENGAPAIGPIPDLPHSM